MLISLNWVQKHCPFEVREEPIKIGERFSLSTAEVEGAVCRGGKLDQFIAAKVEEVRPVEGAPDNIKEVRVDIGRKTPITLICGALNVEKGMVAPYAKPGTHVLGKEITRREVRGVLSEGMLLAEDELELSDSHEGLMVLPDKTRPGTPLSEIYPDLRDVVLEVDNKSLTHRPDLWGHYGIAREFSTIYEVLPMRPYSIDEKLASADGQAGIRVSIVKGEARRRCRRYCGLRIDGIQVGPSPDWLRHQLIAVGSRPINNIVDITNYILFDLGQPLHAFDIDKLQADKIIVRMPKKGETLTLLDGRTIQLHSEDLLIADGNRPVALAGVMGGEDSEITDGTVSIFLESANFEPTSVRLSSLRHGRTESSARFEKSLDPQQARLGILKAAEMILELCPEARVVGELQDVGFEPPKPTVIELTNTFIPQRLGTDLSPDDTKKILLNLGFEVKEQAAKSTVGKKNSSETQWQVTVPSWRATRDVSIREDLVEEVGRIHGYGQIVPYAPRWPVAAPAGNPKRNLERQIKDFLILQGALSEVTTYSMVGPSHCQEFELDADAHLKLQNPMNEELDRMRREIIPIHLEKTRENQRYFNRFGFFEIGRVYRKDPERLREPELPAETSRVAGRATRSSSARINSTSPVLAPAASRSFWSPPSPRNLEMEPRVPSSSKRSQASPLAPYCLTKGSASSISLRESGCLASTQMARTFPPPSTTFLNTRKSVSQAASVRSWISRPNRVSGASDPNRAMASP